MTFLLRLLGSRQRRPRPRLYWLTDDLALSGQPRYEDWEAVRAAGIRCVIDLRAEREDNGDAVERHGLHYLRVPIEEWAAPSDGDLRLTAARVVEAIRRVGPVLVHCREGRGRSALVACAAMVSLGMPAVEAYRLVLRAKPDISLSEQQSQALERLFLRTRSTAGNDDFESVVS